MPRVRAASVPAPESTASRVRRAVTRARARGRAWRISDFSDMPALAVAQALSRLAREGVIVRMSKGVYAAKGSTPERVRVYDAEPQLVGVPLFPCSVTAANMLRLSLQCPKYAWYSTPASFVPNAIDRKSVKVVTRRPRSWSTIEPLDGALLEMLRDGCIHSELEPANTAHVLRKALLERGRLQRIMPMVRDEPPRVRAMLGALLDRGRAAKPPEVLAAMRSLRASLNPLSRYRFGQLSLLPEAQRWQALALKPIG